MSSSHREHAVLSDVLNTDLTRRKTLLGLAGLAGLGLARDALGAGTPTASNLEKFDHIVVLMLENRSFDNLLGYLYGPGQVPRGQRFEGVAGKNLSNPIPPGADEADRGIAPVAPGATMDNPNPDPGEEYPHVNTQLYGTILPDANRAHDALAMAAPFNAPAPLPATAPMDGFVIDYVANFTRIAGRPPTYAEYRVIMDCFQPDDVPVLSTLARSFAVCDHWHCAVPSQTFCNRSFFHAASSSGAVVNSPYAHWVKENWAPTIFDRISAAGDPNLSWRVYYDEADAFALTALLHYPVLRDAVAANFFSMAQFEEDARAGRLPSYAFIEPRLFLDHNDMHPPIKVLGETQASSVLAGEVLVNQVYDAIRLSDSSTGSNWRNTLLVITFDEHGGCYDHVPPPDAVPPDPAAGPGQMGFGFDRLGVRVPTILISAYVEAGTVVNAPLDHGSILRTVETRWGLAPLTARDQAAQDVGAALTRDEPRAQSEWPVITPRPLPSSGGGANAAHPLNELQQAVVGLAIAISGDSDSLADTMTVQEAVLYIQRAVAGPPG